MIIDCFTFFNELDLLEIRLHELADVVDVFCLAESTMTFSGNKKELNYKENKDRFSQFNIITKTVDDMPVNCNSWTREHHQRNTIKSMLDTFDNDDIVIMSDLDEIPAAIDVSKLPELLSACDRVEFSHRLYSYALNGSENTRIIGSAATKLKTLQSKNASMHQLLRNKPRLDWVTNRMESGWHFSYANTIENIALKIKSFSHTEFNKPKYTDIHVLSDRVENGLNIFGRKVSPVTYEKIDESWPEYVFKNQHKFLHLIRPVRDE